LPSRYPVSTDRKPTAIVTKHNAHRERKSNGPTVIHAPLADARES
jgi:hypothetical protein